MRRWLVPTVAAAAVLLLLGGGWWFAGPGSNGAETGDDASFAGGDTGASSDTGADSDEVPGSAGSGEPGFAGTAPPGGDLPPNDPGVDGPANPMAVLIDSYSLHDDGHRLSLSYTIGVPECYGVIDVPRIEQTPRSVTITLTRIPPEQNGDVACIEIALLRVVDIQLDQPLGSRVVLDGSLDGAVVSPGPRPAVAPSPR